MSFLCVPGYEGRGMHCFKARGSDTLWRTGFDVEFVVSRGELNGNKTKQLSTRVSVSSSDMYWQQWVLPRGLGHRIALLCY